MILLFHDTADTVSISIITFCDIAKGFQSGCLSMIGRLFLFQLCILLFKGFLDGMYLFCKTAAFFSGFLNGLRDSVVFLLCLIDR